MAQGRGGDPQARDGKVTSTPTAGIPVGKRSRPGQGLRKRQRGRAARGQSSKSQKGGNVRGSSGALDVSTGAGVSAVLNPQSPGTRGQSSKSQKGANVRGSSGALDVSTGVGVSVVLNPQSPGTFSLPAPACLNGGATAAPVPLQVADGSAICYREVLKELSSDELELPDFQSFEEITHYFFCLRGSGRQNLLRGGTSNSLGRRWRIRGGRERGF